MRIFQRLAATLLSAALFVPCLVNADVLRPALDIQLLSGDGGASLTQTLTGFDLDIDATAFAIVFDAPTPSIDIPDQAFTLHGSSVGVSTFSGTFVVAGGLLSGTFNNLAITILSSGSIDFSADLSYLGGSLSTGLTGGRLEGIGSTTNLAAKLGPITVVPVPAATWLFGSGLIGLVGVARRKA